MSDVIVVLIMFGGFFALVVVIGAVGVRNENRDYAFQHPDDPFSRGVDAQWKGKGPPPSEQEWREPGIIEQAKQAGFMIGSPPRARILAQVQANLKAAAAVRAARRAARTPQAPQE